MFLALPDMPNMPMPRLPLTCPFVLSSPESPLSPSRGVVECRETSATRGRRGQRTAVLAHVVNGDHGCIRKVEARRLGQLLSRWLPPSPPRPASNGTSPFALCMHGRVKRMRDLQMEMGKKNNNQNGGQEEREKETREGGV